MGQFFAKDWSGAPFIILGGPHLVVIGLILLVNLSIYYFRKRFTPRARNIFRWTLAIILVVDEIGWHVWHIAIGQWTVQTMLPLHLCSVLVFVSAYMLISRSYGVYELCYLMGLGAAIQAVMTPDLGLYGYPHFRFFQTFLSHGSIMTAAFYMTVVEGYRPYWKSLLRVAVGLNLYMLVVFGINTLVGGNYMFIMHKPETPSLIDVLGPWPWYILSLEGVGLLVCLLLYLPFALKDWGASKSKTFKKTESPAGQ